MFRWHNHACTCIYKILRHPKLELIKFDRFSKIAGHKINIEKSILFLNTRIEQTKNEVKKKIPLISFKRSKTHKNEFNKKVDFYS
jgi:hypothetical protein